jgi:hypothetical protein
MNTKRTRSKAWRGLAALAVLIVATPVAACSGSGPTASARVSADIVPLASPPVGPTASVAPATTEATVSPTAPPLASFQTPGAKPGAAWSTLTWTELAADSPLQSIRAVVAWSGGYVAYGPNGLWASSDGTNWLPSETVMPTDRMVVVETAAGLAALTFASPACQMPTGPCYPSAAGDVNAWTSADGLNWTPRGPAVGIAGMQLMTAAGGPVGAVASSLDGDRSVVSFSADGVTWKAVSVPGISPTWFCPGAGFGGGRYVLLCPGSTETALGDSQTQPQWSTNGIDWVAGKAPMTTDRPAGMDTILSGRAGFMATGQIPGEAGPPQWWRSNDAGSWQIVADYSPVGSFYVRAVPGGTYTNGWLCADGTRIVALALDSSHLSISGQGWTSWDGKSWTKLKSVGAPQAGQFEIAFPAGVLAGSWWGAAS